MRLRPPKRSHSCPDCSGKVELVHGSKWRCRDILCSSRGEIVDGALAVRERARLIHKPLLVAGNDRKRLW